MVLPVCLVSFLGRVKAIHYAIWPLLSLDCDNIGILPQERCVVKSWFLNKEKNL